MHAQRDFGRLGAGGGRVDEGGGHGGAAGAVGGGLGHRRGNIVEDEPRAGVGFGGRGPFSRIEQEREGGGAGEQPQGHEQPAHARPDAGGPPPRAERGNAQRQDCDGDEDGKREGRVQGGGALLINC